MPLQFDEKLTPREYELMRRDDEQARLNREHEIAIKSMELEAMKLDMKWSQLSKIPLAILLLPIRCLVAMSLFVAYARKIEPSDQVLSLLQGRRIDK